MLRTKIKKQIISKNFWVFYDYPAATQLSGASLNTALKEIFWQNNARFSMSPWLSGSQF
jgi:hypothetical protein